MASFTRSRGFATRGLICGLLTFHAAFPRNIPWRAWATPFGRFRRMQASQWRARTCWSSARRLPLGSTVAPLPITWTGSLRVRAEGKSRGHTNGHRVLQMVTLEIWVCDFRPFINLPTPLNPLVATFGRSLFSACRCHKEPCFWAHLVSPCRSLCVCSGRPFGACRCAGEARKQSSETKTTRA